MTPTLDKHRILEALIAQLESTHKHTAQLAEEIRKDATHEEARPENDKDTRALEQTYLARGQAMRAEAIIEQIALLRTLDLSPLRAGEGVRSGALIAIEDDEATRYLFMAPFGGGMNVEVDDQRVQVITPVSAMGRALLGKREGEDVEVRVPSGAREYNIVAIS